MDEKNISATIVERLTTPKEDLIPNEVKQLFVTMYRAVWSIENCANVIVEHEHGQLPEKIAVDWDILTPNLARLASEDAGAIMSALDDLQEYLGIHSLPFHERAPS